MSEQEGNGLGRRGFVRLMVQMVGGLYFVGAFDEASGASADPTSPNYDPKGFHWAFAVDTTKCIGCGSCMRACRAENEVPEGYYRTWVERFEITEDENVTVQVALGKDASFEANGVAAGAGPVKGFFVPKLCNHCHKSVCTQVCPVGATFTTPDGVVVVDEKRCVGCGYCIQACPYGTRFKNPVTHCADKCTLCYHRITKGLPTACVLRCPVGARMYGNLADYHSELHQILRERRYRLIKPEMGTEPQCFYIGLDKEVE